MDAEDAERLVRKSLEIPNERCSAWSPPDRIRDEYLNEQRSELTRSLIEPYLVSVTPDRNAREFGAWKARAYPMFVVAKNDKDSVLLIDPETGCFSLGSIGRDGIVCILGFSSADALAEWVD